MKICAVVPAKGTSERVERKNTRILDGEYIFRRKLKQLIDCDLVDEVYLDTECDELAALASDLPVRRLRRPQHLASNAADGHEIFAWAASQIPDADILVQALCTAPFVTADTIDRALRALIETADADSLVAVRKSKQYLWSNGSPNYDRGRIPNSVDLPWVVQEAMSLYAVRCSGGTPTRRFGSRPILFELTAREDVDINTPDDLVFAETLCAGERASWNAEAAILKPHLSSPLLSDICAEFGRKAVLPSHLRPTSPGRILGRAKTLQLAAIRPGAPADDWRGIYKALDSYDFIRPGDVIVAATGVPERAYFGDLNATLALRAGAVGAVIDGMTRDTPQVKMLALPIYARGSYCHDVKFEGTLSHMNATIKIGDVEINNDDIVFADEDGVVVIPAREWRSVKRLAIDNLAREAMIRIEAIRGTPIAQILDQKGAF